MRSVRLNRLRNCWLDPSDTVAQLRLISARIGQFQTAEERLAAYERFTGPEGKGLDPAIRSRLALDAAPCTANAITMTNSPRS